MAIPPRVRHILIIASIILVVLVLAGATYQGVATALERREYPHPGQLVDVGGHQLHIYCTGDPRIRGYATVVLEAPEGTMSAAWGWVQAALAEEVRVCSYDRAGLGWSEAGDQAHDPARVPLELHTLLENARVPGPYVLVGQSLGASFARLFASRYPDDTAGLVVIDRPDADEPPAGRFHALRPWLARAGLLRASSVPSNHAQGLPARDAGALASFLNRPDHLTRASRELAQWRAAVLLSDGVVPPDHIRVQELTLGPDRLSEQVEARRVSARILPVIASNAEK